VRPHNLTLMSTKQRPQPFSAAELESLCKALADTTSGLTGTEIGQVLRQVGVDDLDPALTKWKRLFNALAARQNRDRSGDRVLAFISHALAPARYRGQELIFHERRAEVNVTLAFHGLEFCEDGKFRRCTAAATLAEAEERAGRLRKELERRRVEPDVLAFCRPELLADNYFHAVLEATKSVASAIRLRTGLPSDGAELAQQAFGGSDPPLRINAFRSDTERGEQRGFTNLLVGFFGTFRNPTAHAPRVEWPMAEQDALDLLSLASLLHRRIKSATLRAHAD
ncbi:MAG TPA: TIGR02391 family protein, partial [Longimicrobium sp.]|nr:TIGR02391 family protein [Longimicrobium sp.]